MDERERTRLLSLLRHLAWSMAEVEAQLLHASIEPRLIAAAEVLGRQQAGQAATTMQVAAAVAQILREQGVGEG